ncbi:CBN-SET-23 protein [Aphelenchoides avenae]|nr:CBN-SET-23 protein [Aphelenchus avenae]
MDFNYISSNIPGPGAKLEDMEQDLVGCSCADECTYDKGCQCVRYGQDNYAEDGTLLLAPGHSYPVLECHENCSCVNRARPCRNRVVQLGMKVKLEPTYASGIGYGLKAQQAIPAGQFVIEYIGEIISREESARRASERSTDDHNYIFTVEEFIQGL